jgi:hypothetical protein
MCHDTHTTIHEDCYGHSKVVWEDILLLFQNNESRLITGSGGTAPPFLISGLDEGDWSALRPCRFTP